jgi:hypothetical protein
MPGQVKQTSRGQVAVSCNAALSTEERHRNRRVATTRERMLRESLMVLVHHNVVSVEVDKTGANSYAIDVDEVAHRLSHPKYCQHVKSIYDDGNLAADCELVVLTMLKNGRLTRSRTIELVLEEAKTLGGARKQESTEAATLRLEQAWDSLKGRLYITAVPGFSPVQPAIGSVAGKAVASPPSTTAKRSAPESSGVRVKRRRSTAGVAEDSNSVQSNSSVTLWKVNVAIIRQELRHEACVALVLAKRGASAGALLQTMLQHTRAEEHKLIGVAAQSPAVTLEVLYTLLPDSINWSAAELETKLEELYYDQLEIVSRVQGVRGQWGWAVNLTNIVHAMREHCAESIGANPTRLPLLKFKLVIIAPVLKTAPRTERTPVLCGVVLCWVLIVSSARPDIGGRASDLAYAPVAEKIGAKAD